MDLPDTPWKHAVLALAPVNFCFEVLGRIAPFVSRASSRTGRAMNAYKMRMLIGDKPVKLAPRDAQVGQESVRWHRAS